MAPGAAAVAANSEGWISSAVYSPHVGRHIALAFLRRGDQRHGETVRAVSPLDHLDQAVTVASPHFIDAEGERLRA